ncbi:MAG: ABC transporter ATP-binding protein/permease [Lachnospiraceae bacterium]|nr:ABC transporter ATP-binding protein/permease [Lachnospiraceae bacterium]
MQTKGSLNNLSISACLDFAKKEIEMHGITGDDKLRLILSLEELLLGYQHHFGEETDYTLHIGKKKGTVTIELLIRGIGLDLLSDPDSLILIKVLHGWSNAPTWDHVKNVNRITYSIKLYNSFSDNLRFAWQYTKPNKLFLFIAITLQLISVGLLIVAPILSARIIVAFTDEAISQLILTACMLFAVNIASQVFISGSNFAYNFLYNRTLTLLETDISSKVLGVTNQCFCNNGTGLFIQRLTTDTSNLANSFNTMADTLSQVCQYVGILIAMCVVSPLAFAVTTVLLIIQTLLELNRGRISQKNGRLYRNKNERYTGIIGEMIRGIRDIRLIHAESAFQDELQDRIQSANDSRLSWYSKNLKYRLINNGFKEAGALAFVALLGLLLLKGHLAVATALILFNYFTSLGTPAVTLMGNILDFLTEMNLSCERLYALTDDKSFPKERFGTVNKNDIRGAVRFENVCFSYNVSKLKTSTRWVLYNLSFEIDPGETVAFVGKSGCGKTTIMNLISRLYEAFSGKVLIDGINVKELDRDSLRGCMTVVTQNPYIFQMSIRENLRLAKADMTEEEMRNAASLACLDDEIEAMPEQYDTLVGEGGVNLSGGQRQRLAIARSLLQESSILMLDEATSALDNITQTRIQQAVENIRGQKTLIMIAHRLSTVIHSDRIIFIQDGRVLDQGTHQELMDSCKPYRELYMTEEN